jgi:hypothetical protein
MSRKYQVTLPGPVSEQLEQLAAGAEQPPSTLAGQFVQSEVARAAADGRVSPLHRPPPTAGAVAGGERSRWLEPYGGNADWRADMWGQLVALHGRFPKALGGLQEGWFAENELLETMCALAVWRAELDDADGDPREELAFQLQLRELAHVLRQAGGGVTKAWKPGALPVDWSDG